IDIAGHEGGQLAVAGKPLLGRERAIAGVPEEPEVLRELTRGREIDLPVAVEVRRQDRPRSPSEELRDGPRRPEGAPPESGKDREVRGLSRPRAVAGDEVEVAIPVEVAGSEADRVTPGRGRRRSAERAPG